MRNKSLVAALVAALLFVNVVGFLWRKSRKEAAARAAAAETARVQQQAQAAQAAAAAQKLAARANPAEEEELERAQDARAKRALGVASLESGEYERALGLFREAQALLGPRAKVDELIKATEDLRARAKAAAELPAVDAGTVLPAAPVQPVAVPVSPAAATARPRQLPVRPAAAKLPGTGVLLVSTTPRGLLVKVDGAGMDLSPMRASLPPGSHKITLLDGDRVLFETAVEVVEDQVATVLKDLSAELAPKPTAAPAPKPVAPVPSVPAVKTTGGLEVASPGVYGEIWVNGRPQGFPPLKVENLQPGPVKIEVRVNGVVKRSTTATVVAGEVTPVRVVR